MRYAAYECVTGVLPQEKEEKKKKKAEVN